jgi:hypothetical protein
MAVTERIFTCDLMEEIWCMFQLFNNDNMGKISIHSGMSPRKLGMASKTISCMSSPLCGSWVCC